MAGLVRWYCWPAQHVLPPITGIALTVVAADSFRMTAFDTTLAATLVGVVGTGLVAWIGKRFETRRSNQEGVLAVLLAKKEAEVEKAKAEIEELRKRLGS